MLSQGKPSVLISIATKRNIHAAVAQYLLTQTHMASIDIVQHPYPLGHVRNLQVERFLKGTHDYLFFVDSDCVPKVDTVSILRGYNLPFISAPHPSRVAGETGVMVLDKDSNNPEGYVQHRPFDRGVQKCDAVGCAGMFMRRDIFDRVGHPYFKFVYDDKGFLIKGEDFYFCDKLREVGIEIYADCDLIQTHYVEVGI